MPKKGHNELVAGVFVVFGLAVALGVVIWLGVIKPFKEAKPLAYFYLDQSLGTANLSEGMSVQFAGKQIGRIADLQLEPQKHRTVYIVEMDRADVTVYADGRAEAGGPMVGNAVLNIVSPGTPEAGPTSAAKPVAITLGGMGGVMAAANQGVQEIVRQLDPNQPGSLLAKALDTVDSMKKAASDISAITGSMRVEFNRDANDSLLARIRISAAYLQSITGGIEKLLAENTSKITSVFTNVEQMSGKLNQYTQKDLAEILAKIHEASGQIVKISNDFADSSGKVKGLVDRNAVNIDETLDNLMLVSANLKAASAEVRRNPWRLLYKPDEKQIKSADVLEAARAFSSEAEQLDQAMTKLRVTDPNAVDAAQLKTIREHLQQTFERFSKAEQALFKELAK